MDISFEGLFLTAVFLLPGFFVFYIKRYTQPAWTQSLDNFELSLLSLGYSVVIFAFQSLILGSILALIEFDISAITIDWKQWLIEHYFISGFLLCIWIVFASAFAIYLGYKEPLLWFLNRINKQQNFFQIDIWHHILNLKRIEMHATTEVGVTAHLKNGDAYSGWLINFDLKPLENGDRQFALKHVHFIPSKESNSITKETQLDDNSFVLLNTRDIDSLVVTMITPPTLV